MTPEIIFRYCRRRQEMKCCRLPEGEVVEHVNDVAAIVFILFSQMFQYSYLFLGLPVKPLLVSHHFQGDMLMSLVVVNLQNLSKGAFANHFQNLITISNVVMRDVNVRALNKNRR